MTDKEFFVSTIVDEIPRFERAFKALPADKLDYKPDPKGRSAMELMSTIAGESKMFGVFLKAASFDFSNAPKLSSTTIDGLVDEMKAGLQSAQSVAASMTDAEWMADLVMMVDGKEVWKTTRGKCAWGFVLDLIHHRGQLSVYIRPMGGKVPSIYGPSGDSEE